MTAKKDLPRSALGPGMTTPNPPAKTQGDWGTTPFKKPNTSPGTVGGPASNGNHPNSSASTGHMVTPVQPAVPPCPIKPGRS